eukprot:3049915-Pleurochrysis_carterae.AAC.3
MWRRDGTTYTSLSIQMLIFYLILGITSHYSKIHEQVLPGVADTTTCAATSPALLPVERVWHLPLRRGARALHFQLERAHEGVHLMATARDCQGIPGDAAGQLFAGAQSPQFSDTGLGRLLRPRAGARSRRVYIHLGSIDGSLA